MGDTVSGDRIFTAKYRQLFTKDANYTKQSNISAR
jgi:hypothetical protein